MSTIINQTYRIAATEDSILPTTRGLLHWFFSDASNGIHPTRNELASGYTALAA
jgi:hypothetical protein